MSNIAPVLTNGVRNNAEQVSGSVDTQAGQCATQLDLGLSALDVSL
jgi:hypothetical protein